MRNKVGASGTSFGLGAGGPDRSGWADFGTVRARGVVECIDLGVDAARLDEGGMWFVVAEFDGPARAWRFAEVDRGPELAPGRGDVLVPDNYPGRGWAGPACTAWASSCSEAEYVGGVERVRSLIAAGDVYQVNLCRVLSAPLPAAGGLEPDAFGLAGVLARGNPAPYAGVIHVPQGLGVAPVWVVSASPELFLERDGEVLRSGPIKGTAPVEGLLLEKDFAENVMITDLVRNDLATVCEPGSVVVERLHEVEAHPGLVHLVSTVSGRLRGASWAEILTGTFPPGSVSGAPKGSSLGVISDLEAADRGPYCGAVGWVDADAGSAQLAVGIRTFWWVDGVLRFGTGAGITWGSDPGTEWRETELKAGRLVGLASGGGGL